MKEQGLAKIVALKAYLLARQADPEGLASLRSKAERCAEFFQDRLASADLRRYIFYNLVLAESCRDSNPVPYRAIALEAGKLLERLGYADPTQEYMRIVEATTEPKTTAHFGDFNSSSDWSHSSWSNSPLARSQAFQARAAPAFEAVQLSEELARTHERFLWVTSLETLMRGHGVT